MENFGRPSRHGVENQGLTELKNIYWNLTTPHLCEEALRRGEGSLTADGAFYTLTGEHTGRSPNDKFTVKEPSTEGDIWWGDVNKSIDIEKFDHLLAKIQEHYKGRDAFVQDCFVGADSENRLSVRVVTEEAWHSIFVRNLFIPIDDAAGATCEDHVPEFTVIQAPSCLAEPETEGTNSKTFVLVNFAKKLVIIGGTSYAGEIKKSIFSVMNYLMPKKGVLSMHCSANIGKDGDAALFFGLSGTGKTTLSADPERLLIGDDEHGWTDKGVFNFEGGCYAKVIRLDPETEPQIYSCTKRFGTILENVVVDEVKRTIDYDDDRFTENTRAAYPVEFIPGAEMSGQGSHPKNIFMLTCDAFGVLPPISKLTPEQAMYHFLAGYTAKVAGTEKGVLEPQATFSSCFGAPFLPLNPAVYAELLGKKMEEHGANCWLLNTGWTGGAYGVGARMSLPHTRALIHAAMNGSLDNVEWKEEPVFGLFIPAECPGVPAEVLNPKLGWADKEGYDAKAKELADLFKANFKTLGAKAAPHVEKAGPK
ncbi:MAG: phosphoenolpyruvate carboxykinase (ATP) [Deltaproteobacteria bacterium]|nr:MAG: phosphoenolpyruvate carboxykinase (ATP) [Deltaproteobacteria bacterium]